MKAVWNGQVVAVSLGKFGQGLHYNRLNTKIAYR